MAGGDLTPKQRRFVEEYLIDLNATQAAIRAEYSAKNADKIGSELLGKTRVSEAIQQAMAERAKRTQIDADFVLKRLADIASYNVRDFATLTRRTLNRDNGEEFEVQDVEYNENFDGNIAGNLYRGKDGIKIEMPDRLKALELIGKHLGMWKERIEHTGSMTHHIDLSHMSDEEVEAELKKLKGQESENK